MSYVSLEEIAKAIFSTSPLEGAGPDTIPALVWQKLWPAIKGIVTHTHCCLITTLEA